MKKALIAFLVVVLTIGGMVGYFYYKWTNNPLNTFTQFRETRYEKVDTALRNTDPQQAALDLIPMLQEIKTTPLVLSIRLQKRSEDEDDDGRLLRVKRDGGDPTSYRVEISPGLRNSGTIDPDVELTRYFTSAELAQTIQQRLNENP